MPTVLRLALVALGLGLAVYGAASLTGGWLGDPAWWTDALTTPIRAFDADSTLLLRQARPGREWISAGVVVVGLGIAAVGVWSRRGPTRRDGKRFLFVPAYLADVMLIAASSPGWEEVFRAQRGAFGLVAWGPNESGAGYVMGMCIGLWTLAATIWSIRRPSFAWVPVLMVTYVLWFGMGGPRVWTALGAVAGGAMPTRIPA